MRVRACVRARVCVSIFSSSPMISHYGDDIQWATPVWHISRKEIGPKAALCLFCSFFLRAANHPLAGQYVSSQR